MTVEGLCRDGKLNRIQEAFREHHALQCGFCTPGFLLSITALLEEIDSASDAELDVALSGNICRCTGYQGIRAAVRALWKTEPRMPNSPPAGELRRGRLVGAPIRRTEDPGS